MGNTRFEHRVVLELPDGWEKCRPENCTDAGKWGAGVDSTDHSKWDREHGWFSFSLPGSENAPRGGFVIHRLEPLHPEVERPVPELAHELHRRIRFDIEVGGEDEIVVNAHDLLRILDAYADERDYVAELKQAIAEVIHST